MKIEICNECGENVRAGTGLYVNRIMDLNEQNDRIDMGKPYPQGDFICVKCEEEINSRQQNVRN